MARAGMGPRSTTWEGVSDENDPEEQVLTNTYTNSQVGPFADNARLNPKEHERNTAVNWADAGSGVKGKLVNINHPSAKNPIQDGFAILRS